MCENYQIWETNGRLISFSEFMVYSNKWNDLYFKVCNNLGNFKSSIKETMCDLFQQDSKTWIASLFS